MEVCCLIDSLVREERDDTFGQSSQWLDGIGSGFLIKNGAPPDALFGAKDVVAKATSVDTEKALRHTETKHKKIKGTIQSQNYM